jgi:hypothetical protein
MFGDKKELLPSVVRIFFGVEGSGERSAGLFLGEINTMAEGLLVRDGTFPRR